MAEVEHLAQAGVALVLGDDPQLGPRAGGDHPPVVGRRPRAHALPQLAAGDQRRLDDLGVARRQLRGRKRRKRGRVGDHRGRLVVGADVVLGLGQIDAGLAAVGRVDLGNQRRRNLDIAHAALVGGGAEARQVADHAAAERDDDVLAGHARARQLRPDDLGVGDGLRLFAGHDRDAAVERLERIGVEAARPGRR